MRRASSNTPEICGSPPSNRVGGGAWRRRIILLLLLAMPATWVLAGDTGYLTKAVDLLDRPTADAKSITRLSRQQIVQVVGRSGSWASVRAGASSGWVRLIDIRLNATRSASTATIKSGAVKTGIRGFSEEELLVGAPNRVEADKLKAFAVTARDAAAFARSGSLVARNQDYLEMLDYMPEGKPPEGFFDE